MKYALTDAEIALVVEGLEAGAREERHNAEVARRKGYHPQAREFANKAVAFSVLAEKARSVNISRLTARY